MAQRPQFGPGFQSAQSRLYRSEYAFITLVVLAFLVWIYLHAPLFFTRFSILSILEVVFWAIFPDLAAFIPIGVASKKGVWPSWGAFLYNFFHTILVWAAVFILAWVILKMPHWELLGWLGHISTDRAVGYGLRETRNQRLNREPITQ